MIVFNKFSQSAEQDQCTGLITGNYRKSLMDKNVL
jgi:hypothetical protein